MKKLLSWRENAPARKIESEEEKIVRTGREAAALISGGQIGKAMRRLLSNGVASVDDPAVLQQLKEKYPERSRPLPESVGYGDAIPSMSGLREQLTSLKDGSAPGCGLWRSEARVSLSLRKKDDKRGNVKT